MCIRGIGHVMMHEFMHGSPIFGTLGSQTNLVMSDILHVSLVHILCILLVYPIIDRSKIVYNLPYECIVIKKRPNMTPGIDVA